MTAFLVLALRMSLALTLYYFLWRVLQTLRKDLHQQSNILSLQKKPGIHIDVLTDSDGKNKYNFRQAEILIGRGSHCDIKLNDESLSASHARISFHHAQWWLEDLGSTNGTNLNRVPITTPTVVISGDEFQCGNTTFNLSINSFEPQPQTQSPPRNGSDK